ncbi:hypothetical protein BDB01DRAFT_714822 [Pilobolus umbonatus]|nr:hypothetical protein BDB01DRAFT_714822 [Pilobolus umbonatus]
MSDSTAIDKQNLGAACFRCRGFRHACDRKKPSCARCYRRGITCVYPEAAPTLKKLQKATETLSERIKKFGDRLKTEVPIKTIPYQSYTMTDDLYTHKLPITPEHSDAGSPNTGSISSTYSDDDMNEFPRRKTRRQHVASTRNFSIYPCTKCFKDLQQCDLTLPRCSRCEANKFECSFKKTEPKANHVSQVLTTMNKMMDQWQGSIDRMAKDFAQKTRDLSAKANNTLKIKSNQQTAWKITTTQKGISVESNVNSYHDLSTLVDQFKRSLTFKPASTKDAGSPCDFPMSPLSMTSDISDVSLTPTIEIDDASSIHTASGFTFGIWNSWAHPTHALPQDYPIDISQELTDNLIELYCRTPCCSSIRLPIINTTQFLERYRSDDPSKRPSTVLVYAICSMAARNAFQLHVWSKKPSYEAPNYNMGKALSIAYCLRGRELLSDCFDEPSFDNCQAAFLLSYCHYQNGYLGVIYIYEWIAHNMAQELGLYRKDRQLTRDEAMLVWCIYYCNAWYRTLQGGTSNNLTQCKPTCPIPELLISPIRPLDDTQSQEWIDYYVWNSWVYSIQLQVMRDQCMTRLVSYQKDGPRVDTTLLSDLLKMQSDLQEFHRSLPIEWASPNLQSTNSCCSSQSSLSDSDKNCAVNTKSFAQYCTNLVQMHYFINEIILYQVFVPMHHLPSNPISLQYLQTCLNAANQITMMFDFMIQDNGDCHVLLLGFLFPNIIYKKILSYENKELQDLGRVNLLHSIELAKNSNNYVYDFEMARNFVHLIEQDILQSVTPMPTN